MISLQDVQAAQSRIAPYITRTPLLRVPALDEALGCEVYLKFEGFQVMGAFKLRGAMNKALSLTQEELDRGIVCASSGNHAQGVACAAHRLGARLSAARWSWWALWAPRGREELPSWWSRRAW